MVLTFILYVSFMCGGLFVAGLCAGCWTGRASRSKAGLNLEDVADDAGLFQGWDGLPVAERKRRLGLYRQRVLLQSAERDRAWLRAQRKEYAKGW
ncbi:hypothetical protein AvCA_47880 [Azotobacter vinelandii CA]|uniref:Transmembrane protein n=2 Tax=Azotobacter vinelandii TaxID=354 RepID=C1DJY7_AZOVD|nr:hypothetical protein [Azotobacter vinelandii]ACO80892.1 hypothetical protein Avin_47880 [Azotobacter vinelandii DJ]AGK15861.1 hypothetical protein AvCA_47880 [Azotobacter vinelandii CA]AGK22220.1 hypothetical protein AvCA6_47880 [Azotobacter vinelandii CA6]WKN21686.1 hypothetical protein AVAEIV_004794 [Azotobacter vinelandii]SFX00788.1 hypothetical protein SAMN04244547_00131 [Azotobacter vinelandii]